MDHLRLAILDTKVKATRERIMELRKEVMEMDALEAELRMSLQDVLIELSTPAGSDSEDDEPVCGLNATDKARVASMSEADHHMARDLLQQMRSAKAEPTSCVSFANLYRSKSYQMSAERKMKKLARFLNKADFNDSFSDESYWKEVSELKNLYPESDERPGLLELVAFFNHQRKKFEFFFGTSEEEDDDDEDEESGQDENVDPRRVVNAPTNYA